MSWGNKLVLVFVAFAALIGTLVYKSMHTNFELVTKDYYKEELRFQQKIDGARNAAQLSAVTLTQDSSFVTVVMPSELKARTLTGELLFYCGSDASKDLKLPLKLDTQGNQLVQLVSKRLLAQGAYQVKLSWQADDSTYYVEKPININ
ncbi:FixH family protein [Filimonas effusa]|uniref:Nitrogen fixation protein FixH n=1 Tax=Filimonas effusa TaxID=2508721 RepID=A0A4Q1D6V9_9BACT|nr:FixH family protein [Filimonas effusa]RXK83461.1 hypothetical protein ESB13_15310 [Filimonas effusa]